MANISEYISESLKGPTYFTFPINFPRGENLILQQFVTISRNFYFAVCLEQTLQIAVCHGKGLSQNFVASFKLVTFLPQLGIFLPHLNCHSVVASFKLVFSPLLLETNQIVWLKTV